jgi:hypothetical protein
MAESSHRQPDRLRASLPDKLRVAQAGRLVKVTPFRSSLSPSGGWYAVALGGGSPPESGSGGLA